MKFRLELDTFDPYLVPFVEFLTIWGISIIIDTGLLNTYPCVYEADNKEALVALIKEWFAHDDEESWEEMINSITVVG